MRHGAAALLIPALGLAACAGQERQASPEPDRQGARRQLAAEAKAGPVPLLVAGDPTPLEPSELPALAARGVTALDPVFATGPTGGRPHLVLWFGPPPGATAQRACGSGPLPTYPASPPRLLAVWCADLYAVAGAEGAAGGADHAAAERMVWQTTGHLFPDDYAETYGLNLFGWRVRLGGAVGFGR